MSVFTNRASRSADQARDYTAAILALVGGREPMDVLRQTPDAVRSKVAGLSDSQLSAPEAGGNGRCARWCGTTPTRIWSGAIVCGWCWRTIVRRLPATIRICGLNGFATIAPTEQALRSAVLRRSNLSLLVARPPRIGSASACTPSEESVDHMIRMYAGHDLLHLQQLDRIRAAVAAI
jgi:hypothetical protein